MDRIQVSIPYVEPFKTPDGIEDVVYPLIKTITSGRLDWSEATDVLEE